MRMFSLFAGILLSILSNVTSSELLVVVSEYTEEYVEVGHRIIDTAGHSGQVVLHTDLDMMNADHFKLVVSVGKNAVLSINNDPRFKNIPVISAFAPRSTYQPAHYRTAVFSDVNLEIYLKLIQSMFPSKVPRIGVFVDDKTTYQFLSVSERNRNIVLIPKTINQGEKPAHVIENFINENKLDAFIILPLSSVYDQCSLVMMLYSLHQLDVAAIAYTPKLVESGIGAVAAVYFDKTEVISTVSEVIKSFYNTGRLLEQARTPKKTKVVVNEGLAKVLKLDPSNLMKYGEIHEQ